MILNTSPCVAGTLRGMWRNMKNGEYLIARSKRGGLPGMIVQRVEQAIENAFTKNNMDPASFTSVNYLVHMHEADARELHAEMQAVATVAGGPFHLQVNAIWYTFDEFVSNTAIRIDPSVPKGSMSVEFFPSPPMSLAPQPPTPAP